jgi:two-component sensor histidine kinase
VRYIGLALHELATNAAKYGALSAPDGRIVVSWGVTAGGNGETFELTWLEHGGPAWPADGRRGFGQTVLSEIVPAALGGASHLEQAPHGLRWSLRAPAMRAIAQPGTTAGLTA